MALCSKLHRVSTMDGCPGNPHCPQDQHTQSQLRKVPSATTARMTGMICGGWYLTSSPSPGGKKEEISISKAEQ